MPRRVLGIDPGTRVVGYAVVEKQGNAFAVLSCGVIKPRAADPLPDRLRVIFEGISAEIVRHRPEAVAVEEVFAGKGPRSSITIGEGRGVVLLAAGMARLPVAAYAPRTIKKAITGGGEAGKTTVKRMLQLLTGFRKELPLDATDALAVAVCHLGRAPGLLIGAERFGKRG